MRKLHRHTKFWLRFGRFLEVLYLQGAHDSGLRIHPSQKVCKVQEIKPNHILMATTINSLFFFLVFSGVCALKSSSSSTVLTSSF